MYHFQVDFEYVSLRIALILHMSLINFQLRSSKKRSILQKNFIPYFLFSQNNLLTILFCHV